MEMHNPPHSGETLREFYIKEHKLSIAKAASMLGLSRKHLSNIINSKVLITTDVALRLPKCFKTTPDVWLKEQLNYDLWHAKQTVNLDNVQVAVN